MKLNLTLFLFFLISLGNLTSCLRQLPPLPQEDSTGHLHVALENDITTFDPVNAFDVVSAEVIYQIYEPLFEYNYLKRPYTLQPLLASEMPLVQNNGHTYIIKIKKGVRYHDDPCFKGKERTVKAQDFILQIKRLAFKPLKSNGWWFLDGKILGLNEFREKVGSNEHLMQTQSVEGLNAPDDFTLIIKLTHPNPQFIYALSLSHTVPIPHEAIDYYQNQLSGRDLGTGPFALAHWQPELAIVLKKYPHYRTDIYPSTGDRYANDMKLLRDANKTIPFLDRITFFIIKSPQDRLVNFLARKFDFMIVGAENMAMVLTPQAELRPEIKRQGITLLTSPSLTYWWLAFNMQHPLLGQNLYLRQSIAHAINFNQLIDTVTQKTGQRANSIFPPGIPGYDPTRHLTFSYDPHKAEELLALAGYPKGLNLPIIRFDLRRNEPRDHLIAYFIKEELAKIGIRIQPIFNTYNEFLSKARAGTLEFWYDGWALDYPDAENILQLLITKNFPPGPNSTYYHNEKFDELYQKFKLMKNVPEKFMLMGEMENMVMQDLPWIMTYYDRDYLLSLAQISNLRYSDLIYNRYKYIRSE